MNMRNVFLGRAACCVLLVAACFGPAGPGSVGAEPLKRLGSYDVLRLPGARERVLKVRDKTGVSMDEAATAVILAEAELNAEMCGFALNWRYKDIKRDFIRSSRPHRAFKYAKSRARFPLGAGMSGHCEEVFKKDRHQGPPFFRHPDSPTYNH